MRIAVTYDDGMIFQHFGKTEEFKLYDVENGKVRDSRIISSNGEGHGALAGVLADNDVDILICGGIGGGAQAALSDAGIEIVSGAVGNADEVVDVFLIGELESAGVTCDHHGEGHSCGHHEENYSTGDFGENDGSGCGSDGCGSGCGSSCPGCGSSCSDLGPKLEGKNVGKVVRAHYKGTFNDGTQFDSSYDRGEPLEFVCGAGMMIAGFDAAVANMEIGESVDVHLLPEEAYGMPDPSAIFSISIAGLPGAEELPVGEQVYLTNAYGQPIPVKVVAKDDTTITFDANHEMAGKELNFHIELVSVEEN